MDLPIGYMGRLDVRRVDLPIRRLPSGFEGLRIAHLSDLHGVTAVRGEPLAKVVERLAPDMVAITGDLVDTQVALPAVMDLAKALVDLAPLGAFFVLGNHEYHPRLFRGHPSGYFMRRAGTSAHGAADGVNGAATFAEHLCERLRQVGVRVLINESVALSPLGGAKRGGEPDRDASTGSGVLWVCGVDDPHLRRARLAEALPSTPPGNQPTDPILLLAHSPEIWQDALRHPISLTLTGHTHGGQVCLPWWGPVHVSLEKSSRRYYRGIHRLGDGWLYVNRGIGTSGLPLRMLARPEVALFTLHRSADG